jgi:BirA family biotin operon repressor/biotin-[acetyl-CoA-carboxylase] ligase
VLTLMAGLAVAESIQEATALATDLRWPNDVMVGEKKCAGILVEMTAEPVRISHVLIGIGINVNQQQISAELAADATSLFLEAGRNFSRLEILVSVLKQLEHYYNRLQEAGAQAIVARFEEVSSYARGRRVRVTEGAKVVEGVTDGLAAEGLLLVRRDDGQLEPILSGRVRSA